MRKFQKEQDEKKFKSNNFNWGGRNPSTSRGNSNKNGVSGAKISKNPNSSNYKGEGESPECSKCSSHPSDNKKRHWPYDCWTQHPKRAPKRFKNKLKANVVRTNNRLDDFVNRNDTHISAMARMTACEEDLMGDEEYWGLSGGKFTPNLGGSLPCVKRTNKFFEQIFNLVENEYAGKDNKAVKVIQNKTKTALAKKIMRHTYAMMGWWNIRLRMLHSIRRYDFSVGLIDG